MATFNEPALGEQYLSFFVAGEEYAIGILRVKEILEFGTVTKVPAAPLGIRGVINLRGGVVPVVDLAVKLGLPPSEVTKRSCIVIVELEAKATVMGLMADTVSQLLELGPKDIEPPPEFGTRMDVDYLCGMGKAGTKFVLLLDIDRVLSTVELLAAASTPAPAASTPAAHEDPPSDPGSAVEGSGK